MSVNKLRLRAYNVGLGDCILITASSRRGDKHILVDFGSTRGKDKSYLAMVWKHIRDEIAEDDLAVVLTHGHMDHFKGLFYHLEELTDRTSIFITTAHLRTKETRRIGTRKGPLLSMFDSRLRKLREKLDADDVDGEAEGLARERVDTDEMIDIVCQKLGDRVRYLHRGKPRILTHFLRGTGAEIDVLAPEKDGKQYADAVFSRFSKEGQQDGLRRGVIRDAIKERLKDHTGLSLRDLLWADRSYDNETSLVLLLKWKGKRVLLTGDAEETSWKIMHERGLLEPFDVLKVSHHASANGTPIKHPNVWNSLVDYGRKRKFIVSTYPRKDWGMPSRSLLKELATYGEVYSTENVEGSPGYVEVVLMDN